MNKSLIVQCVLLLYYLKDKIFCWLSSMLQEALKLIMNSMISWLSETSKIIITHRNILNRWTNVIKNTTNCWCKMAKRLTFFSPNSSDQVKVPMRKSTKRLVKSIPGYMQLLKDFDDSKYHSMTIQKYSNT